MFLAIDTFLLERVFTPFAWWFERKTGQTNFYLVWWCFGIAVVNLVGHLALGLLYTHNLDLSDFIFGPLTIVMLGVMLARATRWNDMVSKRPAGAPSFSSADPLATLFRLGILLLSIDSGIGCAFMSHGWVSIIADARVLEQLQWALQEAFMGFGLYFLVVKRPPPRFDREDVKGLVPIPVRN